jgi:uncharacterized Zn finger protein
MGRPYKCPGCGSSNNTSKGVRKTKQLGVRRIRLCKECGKKFTPKNQKATEAEEQPAATTTPAAPAAPAVVAKTEVSTAVPTETATPPATSKEVVDHPRY